MAQTTSGSACQRAASQLRAQLAATVQSSLDLETVLRAVHAACGSCGVAGSGNAALHSLAAALSASHGLFVTVRSGLGGGSGDASLSQLKHTYLIVQTHRSGQQIVVDPCFREQFCLGFAAGAVYAACVEGVLPRFFVGSIKTITTAVQLLGAELQRFAQNNEGMSLPPWRSTQGLASKWLPLNYRDELYAAAVPGVPQPAQTNLHPLLRNLQQQQVAPAPVMPIAAVEYTHLRGRLVVTSARGGSHAAALVPGAVAEPVVEPLPSQQQPQAVVYGFQEPPVQFVPRRAHSCPSDWVNRRSGSPAPLSALTRQLSAAAEAEVAAAAARARALAAQHAAQAQEAALAAAAAAAAMRASAAAAAEAAARSTAGRPAAVHVAAAAAAADVKASPLPVKAAGPPHRSAAYSSFVKHHLLQPQPLDVRQLSGKRPGVGMQPATANAQPCHGKAQQAPEVPMCSFNSLELLLPRMRTVRLGA